MHADTDLKLDDRERNPAIHPLATVLLATDGSTHAAIARRVAADLAARAGAKLHVVIAWRLPVATYMAPAIPPDAFDFSEAAARAVLDEQTRGLPPQMAVTAEALRGSAADIVIEVSRRIEADIIVLGSRGLGALGRLFIGSVADAVVRHAGCPILVARGGEHDWPCRRIIVGVDGSQDAERAANEAAVLAQTLDVPLELVGVESPGSGGAGAGAELDALRQNVDRLAAELTGGGTRAHAVVCRGDAAAMLLAMADGDARTLLTVGRRGVGGLQHALLGSVSNAVLHGAPGPVLIVPHRVGHGVEAATS